MKTLFLMLAVVGTPFTASASIVMPLGPAFSAPFVVPETPNDTSPEAPQTPAPKGDAPTSSEPAPAVPEEEPQTDQLPTPFPPLIDAGENFPSAPSSGSSEAGRL